MAERLAARGPDSQGVWTDDVGIALGHRRLSIIDVSDAGAQPMVSASGRWVIAYNGELYNTAEMRRALDGRGIPFRGHSDTEVLLETIEAVGVEAALRAANGIFAFAAWDRREKRLWLARDRLGVKPLYWGRIGGQVLFASQPKAFFAHPGFTPEIDAGGLTAYLRYGYVPAPLSIYRDVRKLPGGWLAEIDADGAVDERCWWDVAAVAAEGVADTSDVGVDDLGDLIDDAVARQMVSDVPLGAFLSGGIDSSAVVAAMQAHGGNAVCTFAVGFAESGFDETEHARAVAAHLGTEHTEIRLAPGDVPALFDEMLENLDEPVADVSLLPTYAVSRLARQQVTVALSGDGGDELFAGYNHYQMATQAWRLARRLPGPLARGLAGAVHAAAPALQHTPWGGTDGRVNVDRLSKLVDLLPAGDAMSLYRRFVSHWLDPGIAAQAVVTDDAVADIWRPPALGLPAQYQCFDMMTYLPEDVLAKVDRASMACGLEARVPLLDHRVVELAWRTPATAKIRDGVRKWLLRQVLYRRVPRALVERPKMGFGVPMGAWMRDTLHDWVAPVLDNGGDGAGGLLRAAAVDRRWREHVAGRRNWQLSLWGVVVLAQWQRRWLNS